MKKQKIISLVLAATLAFTSINSDINIVHAEENTTEISSSVLEEDTTVESVSDDTDSDEENAGDSETESEAKSEKVTESESESKSDKVTETESNLESESESTSESEAESETEDETETITQEQTEIKKMASANSGDEITTVTVDISDRLYQAGSFDIVSKDNQPVTYSVDTYEEVVETLYQGMKNRNEEIDISSYNVTESVLSDIFSGVINEHPDLFYVGKKFGYSYGSGKVYSVSPKYNDFSDDDLKAFDNEVDKALSVIEEGMTDMDKAIALHDYLVLTCEYDKENLDKKSVPDDSYTAYGVLVKKIAVCQGYALAYKYLCNKLGIECLMVTSDSMNHAWNLIKLGDEYYQVDTTWDDPTTNAVGKARHYYMFISDDEFGNMSTRKHYSWVVTVGSTKVDYKATDTTYDNYFWTDCDNQMLYDNGDYYYVTYNSSNQSCYMNKYDGNTKETSTFGSNLGIWYVWGGTSSLYPYAFAGVYKIGDRICYNTSDSIKCVDSSGKNVQTLYTIDETTANNGYIYNSFLNIDGKIEFIIGQNPNSLNTKSDIRTLSLNDLNLNGEYTVIFKDWNGTELKKETVALGESATPPEENPTREGYTFTGWSGNYKNVAGDTTITAKYKAITYNITYEIDESDTNNENPSTYTIESDTITLKDASKTGYTFDGWYSDSSFNTKVTSIKKGSIGDITLYAKWTIKKYTVTFKDWDGTVLKTETVEYKGKATPPTDLTREGYTFNGWSALAFNYVTQDETITAKYIVITYGIYYELDDGTNDTSNPSSYTIESDTITLKDASKADYTFDGWYSDSEFKTRVTSIPKGSTGDISLYAKWKGTEYNVTFNDWNGKELKKETVKSGESATPPTDPTREGYKFTGWSGNYTNVSKNETVTAQYEVVKYNITYNLNGGTNATGNPSTYTIENDTITLKDASKTGYTFDGWYSDSLFKTEVTSIPKGSTGDITLYAKWTAVYTVTFKDWNGAELKKEAVKSGESVTPPTNPTREYYTFKGWSGTYQNVTKDETVTAQYTATEYSITYNLNGGTNANDNPLKYTIESDTITLKDASKTGYTFEGWYSDSSYETKVTSIPKGSTGDKTLYAKWTAVYTVIFKDGNGTELKTETVKSGENATPPTDPTREGYKFTGWSGNYRNVSKNETVTAQYEIVEYNITYNLDSGTNATDNPSKYAIESDTITLKDASKTGYIFEGWYSDSSLKNEVTSIPKGSTGNITFYAKWIKILGVPTFGYASANTSDGGNGRVAIDKGTKVTITTAETGASIYYTTDGSTPTNASNRYSSPIAIDKDMTIKAVAVKDDCKDSDVVSITFVACENELELSSNNITLKEGETHALTVTKLPTFKTESDITWEITGTEGLVTYENGTVTAATGKDGTATIKASTKDHKGNTVTAECTVTVETFNAGELWISDIDDQTYTGAVIKPEVNVYYGATLLVENQDYTVSYKNNTKANDSKDLATAPTVSITGKGNYTGKASATFKINPIDINDASADDITLKYTGKAQKVDVAVYYGGQKLKNNSDYTQEINSVTEVGTYEVTISGNGNYGGEKKITVKVLEKETQLTLISKATVSKIANQTYTGQALEPQVTVKLGKETIDDTCYTVEYEDNINAGTASVIITGTGDYSGTKRVTFKITAIPMKKVTVSDIENQAYTGNEVELSGYKLSTTLNGDTYPLKEGEDYTVTYKNNIKAGKATITFKGINGFSGTVSKTFTIGKVDIETAEIDYDSSYTKGGTKPSPVVTVDGTTLCEGTDYSVKYSNNKGDVGSIMTMTITGKGNYSGSRTEKFAITEKDISTVTMASADKVFKNSNGNHKITPKFIDSNGKALKAGVDYTTPVYTYADDTTLADGTPRSKGEEVQAADRLSVGTVVNVRIEGLGNYSGTLTESYRIIQKSIKSATVSVASQTYTGSEIKPSKSDIIVKIDGKPLSDDEYEITGYTNNTKVGTASLTIHATSNNYGGTKTVKFKITQIKMKK